ncbi:MAG: hypothetical protein K2Q21_05565 [Chitinophagaceae bacterium]|nr:hypothetical protein [Chitinophagaceae bacterium]
MNKFKKIISLALLAFVQLSANAQAVATNSNQNDLMRSNGKIFLVMTIVVVIMAGLLFYVYTLDKKISKLEKK